MLERGRVGVDRAVAVQVGVQRKVGQGLPGRLVRAHLQPVQVQRRVVPHRRAGHHRDALHAVPELATFLQRAERTNQKERWRH